MMPELTVGAITQEQLCELIAALEDVVSKARLFQKDRWASYTVKAAVIERYRALLESLPHAPKGSSNAK